MNLRDDSGMTLAELMVVLLLMGVVMAAVYMGLQFTTSARNTSEQQAVFASSITAPLDSLDLAFSQSMTPATGTSLDPYSVTLEMPSDYLPGQTVRRTFTANTDGTLVEYEYRGAGTTLWHRYVWSKYNRNRSLSSSTTPLFAYYVGSSTPATDITTADNVVITIVSQYNGKTFRDSRRVYFRNR